MFTFLPQLHFPRPAVTVPVGACSPRHLYDAIASLFAAIRWHVHTLMLFTYTDYKTIFIPVTMFAAVAAPVHSPRHLLHAMIWTWVHLLQCNVSNQYKTPEEDMVSRAWRPIPSGRVSLEEAFCLRVFLIPVCLGVSWMHGWSVFITSAGLTSTMVMYDEIGFAGHWFGKNLCNVFGYLTFEIGATKIMGQTASLDTTALQALLCSAAIILTTIQAQDFADVVGDAKIGRVTFPIYAPSFSRIFTLLAMIAWSIFLSMHWSLGFWGRTFFCSLGAMIGLRYYLLRESKQDYTFRASKSIIFMYNGVRKVCNLRKAFCMLRGKIHEEEGKEDDKEADEAELGDAFKTR